MSNTNEAMAFSVAEQEAEALQQAAKAAALKALRLASLALEDLAAVCMAKPMRKSGLAQEALGFSGEVDMIVMAME